MGGYMEEAHAYSHLHRVRLTALAGKIKNLGAMLPTCCRQYEAALEVVLKCVVLCLSMM